ncbi:MAG: DUF1810 domain-containing protein [Clostridiales bacterium]|nr:DUF1810 domain-containing protein [Clostridiales bacterium]
MNHKEYHLERFVKAQKDSYGTAVSEIRNGRKRSHWMWYIFPQIIGLGRSETAVYYSIVDEGEARAYMQNDLLKKHLLEISNALLEIESSDPERVMGFPDNLKLQSCMTLFAETAPEEDVFQKVLDKYFDGEKDRHTLQILGRQVRNND